MSTCVSYEPGHRLHWSLWSVAQLAPEITVSRIDVEGHHLLIEVAGKRAFDWQHHDPAQLAYALEHAIDPVRLCPTHRILHVDGAWFGCAERDAVLSPCG